MKISAWLVAALFTLIVAPAAAAVKQHKVYMPDGKQGYVVYCTADKNQCYESAGTICKDAGYAVFSLASAKSVTRRGAYGGISVLPRFSLMFSCGARAATHSEMSPQTRNMLRLLDERAHGKPINAPAYGTTQSNGAQISPHPSTNFSDTGQKPRGNSQ
jgi:hypothetical protein